MSAQRSQWEPEEKLLLSQIRSEMPTAKLRVIFQAFNAKNHLSRTKNAVKAKLKELDLFVEGGYTISAPFEHLLTPSREFPEIQYLWSVPELGIFIPLHPLIAEARRHALNLGHTTDVSMTPKWSSALGGADISQLRCAEGDRVALRNYLDYLGRSTQGHQAQNQDGENMIDPALI